LFVGDVLSWVGTSAGRSRNGRAGSHQRADRSDSRNFL